MNVTSISPLKDPDLTSLNWLNKPNVLTSVCSPLVTTIDGDLKQIAAKRRVKDPNYRNQTLDNPNRMLDAILNVRIPRNGIVDTNRPQLSFACMIFMAIESSSVKMLPVRDIYQWIMCKFPYYKTAQAGWRNSVRHNLSLNKCFYKVEKSKLQGWMTSFMPKGSYWTIDKRYRRSLLTALKRTPYHPYHKYFQMNYAEEEVFGEVDMNHNFGMFGVPPITPVTLHAIEMDHSYAVPIRAISRSNNLELAEESTIAHVEAELRRMTGMKDAAYESGEDTSEEEELERMEQLPTALNDSGYSDTGSTIGDLDGANALLRLAATPSGTPIKHTKVA